MYPMEIGFFEKYNNVINVHSSCDAMPSVWHRSAKKVVNSLARWSNDVGCRLASRITGCKMCELQVFVNSDSSNRLWLGNVCIGGLV